MELEYIGELKKELVDFFIEMQEYRQYFKRKLYEEAFQKCYENHREMLAKICLLYTLTLPTICSV